MQDRDESKKITKNWVEAQVNKRITPRDRYMLDILKKHKLVDRDQLIKLAGLDQLSQSTKIINNRLKMLYRMYFVDRTFPYVVPGKGSIPYIYALDRASAYLYDIKPWKRNIRHIKDINGNIIKKLPINFLHHLFINDTVCAIMEICKQQQWKVAYYGVEEENLMSVSYMGKSAIVPDLLVIVQNTSGQSRSFFIEIDLGNESRKILETKIGHYHMLKVCKAWIDSKWYIDHIQKFVSESLIFPHILFLTGSSSGARNMVIRNRASHYKLVATVMPLYKFQKWFANIFSS